MLKKAKNYYKLSVKELAGLLLSPYRSNGEEYDKGALVIELGRRMLLGGRSKITDDNRKLIKNCLKKLTQTKGEVGVLAKDWCRELNIPFGGPLPPIMHL